ncbi:MAG: hypothetical protein ACKVQR_04785 [Aquabacterium sp.]
MSLLISSLQPNALARLAARQAVHLFPDEGGPTADDLSASVPAALQRLEHCFSHVGNRYFFDGSRVQFDHLHGDQYAMWLYLLSNQLYRDGAPPAFCKKLFLLNKALHGCDVFYEVDLPSVFLLVHPLGTVLGRAQYADHLIAYQRVGIGSNHDVYPRLGRHVTLRPGSSVLGRCSVGDNVTIAAESLVLDRDVPAHHTFIGDPRQHRLLPRPHPEPLWRT